MDPQIRFEILQQVAAGDFATVYRARDRELGREVAIKQIHAQFLQDPRHLDRYWQEAQILASLEHPHIVRIYDLVRDRGWLVLELMQGSLKQMLDGRPIDLNDLRMTLTYTAHALQFMHANGILHGDVKPSNLLVDKSQRVKLGDFGIARRITGDHGSVVKGTTRYMAPEVLSDQFGPVGPHSDLYSLGFSAYELLCGANFDSLFPGLNLYGRDPQIAWMMWHSAIDRRLPDVQRVLEGVPDDLAYVIQRLVEKDVARRYRTADELLHDLRTGATGPSGPTPEELAEAEALQRRQAAKRRWLAIGACLASVSASALLLFAPPPRREPSQPTETIVRPTSGRVGEVDPDTGALFIQPDDGSTPYGIEFNADLDRVFVNDQRGTLADLRHGERVAIRYLSSDGREFVELAVTRAAESTVEATVASIDPATAVLVLDPPAGAADPVSIYVPDGVSVQLNGHSRSGTRPYALVDLQAGDRALVRYVPAEEERLVAQAVEVRRKLTHRGVVTSRLPGKNQLEVQITASGGGAGETAAGVRKFFTLASDCRLTLNDLDRIGDAPLSVADLQPGDSVVVEADVEARSIVAKRELRAAGVVARIDATARTLDLTANPGDAPRTYKLAPQSSIRIDADGPPVELAFVRTGDRAEVELATAADASGARVIDSLRVTPAPDPRAWAVLIGQQQFDDSRLPALKRPAAELAALRTALVRRYRTPESQILTLENASRLRLQQELVEFVKRVPGDTQLIAYVSGLAYLAPDGAPILATKEFDVERMAETGAGLRWLVDELGKAAAREKILLIDTSPADATGGGPALPSTFEAVDALRPKPNRPISAGVLIVGSCDKGQRSRAAGAESPGFFATATASAFGLAADANRDQRVGGAELIEYLAKTVGEAAGDASPQRTVVWQPEDRPPRLAPPVRAAIAAFLTQVRGVRLEDDAAEVYQSAAKETPGQPDLTLAFALALLRHNRTPLSRPLFEKVRAEHPKCSTAHQALAWQNFLQGKYVEGLADLKLMIETLPDPAELPENEPYFRQAVELAGTLREFALRAADPPVEPAAARPLDQAVIARGDAAKAAYQKGVDSVRAGLQRIDEDLAAAIDAGKQKTLQLDRRRLSYYAAFNFAAVGEYLKFLADE